MKKQLLVVIALVAVVGSLNAGTTISTNIGAGGAEDVVWAKDDIYVNTVAQGTSGHPYHLSGQIYVEPGSSLTIDAGVVIASFLSDQGALAVCRDADIFVNGTATEPVIMTSAEDVATWAGSVVVGSPVTSITTLGDPKTGTWRESCLEWGNLTIMGNALTTGSSYGGSPITINDEGSIRTNDACPSGLNKRAMEGLTAGYTGDGKVLFGGADDNDDSGSINYLSLRYGGKVINLTNELNGLSLGGLGRGTDISHVEIMNNVDDGIEIWGGTVELDHVSIWNIGDDSLDVDQGWRGSASYGLIVQGFSTDDSQGSGVGDNCIETDGAEDSDAQPMTTAMISNFTVVGQPVDGDGGTAWRDNARVQYDNCIWTDLGELLVRPDGDDGDGQSGYGHNGTLSWADTWTTTYNEWIVDASSLVNLCGESLAAVYGAYISQDLDGNLAQITNSVFYNNNHPNAYVEATARGVLDAGNNNTVEPATSPIQSVVRGDAVLRGGKIMLPVEFINPMPTAGVSAGAFNGCNWLAGWTAADAFGMTDTSMNGASADLDCDGIVDLSDLSSFSSQWLQ